MGLRGPNTTPIDIADVPQYQPVTKKRGTRAGAVIEFIDPLPVTTGPFAGQIE